MKQNIMFLEVVVVMDGSKGGSLTPVASEHSIMAAIFPMWY